MATLLAVMAFFAVGPWLAAKAPLSFILLTSAVCCVALFEVFACLFA